MIQAPPVTPFIILEGETETLRGRVAIGSEVAFLNFYPRLWVFVPCLHLCGPQGHLLAARASPCGRRATSDGRWMMMSDG